MPEQEAKLRYNDADYDILRPGSFVICVVTGAVIPLEELKYWNVDRQEPYADLLASFKRHQEFYQEPNA
jgi:hypothetical protein